MEKDKRYATVRQLIDNQKIDRLSEIFKFIPKSVVARDLHMALARFNVKLSHIEKFQIGHMILLARLLEVKNLTILELAASQYKSDNKKKRKRS